MKILGIDTSNQAMSIALVDEDGLVIEKTVNIKRNHSIQLMPSIEALFGEANWVPKDIDRVAVASGPGSYTGVRIGVTVAKTLAYAVGAELVGVSSLHVLAGNGEQIPGSFIVPLFDARRGNIYTGLYHYQQGVCRPVQTDTHIAIEKWADFLEGLQAPVQLVGTDVNKHMDVLNNRLGDRLLLLAPSQTLPRASVLAELARDKKPEVVHTFEPSYLKLAEAEQKWMETQTEESLGGGWIEKL
ncbi:TsaB protein, required for threonylcarbamoyladenosine (t(6)A) formation in tRNA [Alkalibacterium sp. AK22]|uniref:tRNA (adenosine(37)-N6)-threonylcarbamoyltransferase complex dimerization subunit type 1 TsaB n=1 Tax=Alkalibacterium sp. AK22 TaxID=1229520 RepID=UPI00044EA9D9|nr:tRNA (adenosine(37)-N6)-threonylcarbamoyltransferase complex dimerization subunit type 1 TsaB [Alkalibacterium sp. AK22]EXJ23589.1 TsaB protein, required for threonylcarbamoyladenosine (t(6)A) formation in tRNA [Alkalibacterium sp. AK22]